MSFKKGHEWGLVSKKREGTGQRDAMSVWIVVIINQKNIRTTLNAARQTGNILCLELKRIKRHDPNDQTNGWHDHTKFQHRIYLEVNGRKI